VLDTSLYKYKQIKHESPTKQRGVKTNITSFLRGNCSGHHNTELQTWRHEN